MTKKGETQNPQRVSLAPLNPVDALRALLAVDPDEVDAADNDEPQDEPKREEAPGQ